MSSDESISLIDKIKNWLNEEKLQFNDIQDSENDATITLWSNPMMKIQASTKRDKLTLSATIEFSQKTRSTFSSNLQYFHDLDLSLHQQIPNFRFNYLNTELIGVEIFKKIWSESLTKTSFFDSVSALEHSVYVVIIKDRQFAQVPS